MLAMWHRFLGPRKRFRTSRTRWPTPKYFILWALFVVFTNWLYQNIFREGRFTVYENCVNETIVFTKIGTIDTKYCSLNISHCAHRHCECYLASNESFHFCDLRPTVIPEISVILFLLVALLFVLSAFIAISYCASNFWLCNVFTLEEVAIGFKSYYWEARDVYLEYRQRYIKYHLDLEKRTNPNFDLVRDRGIGYYYFRSNPWIDEDPRNNRKFTDFDWVAYQ